MTPGTDGHLFPDGDRDVVNRMHQLWLRTRSGLNRGLYAAEPSWLQESSEAHTSDQRFVCGRSRVRTADPCVVSANDVGANPDQLLPLGGSY
jgi:hypothetical protein